MLGRWKNRAPAGNIGGWWDEPPPRPLACPALERLRARRLAPADTAQTPHVARAVQGSKAGDIEMVQMTQEREWQKWRSQEINILGESIAWAANVFETTDVGVEGSRHYGCGLLAHSIECARAIRLCINKGLPSPAFALARVQYEGALRGHIIIHEIDLETLGNFLDRTQRWLKNKQSQQPPPMIEIRGTQWKCGGAGRWRPLQYEIAKLFVGSVGNVGLLHDLTHSGVTHALQMYDEEGYIGPCYSAMNQTLLLCFAQKTVMFATMTWPGAEQKYCREIEQRIERISQLRSMWEPGR